MLQWKKRSEKIILRFCLSFLLSPTLRAVNGDDAPEGHRSEPCGFALVLWSAFFHDRVWKSRERKSGERERERREREWELWHAITFFVLSHVLICLIAVQKVLWRCSFFARSLSFFLYFCLKVQKKKKHFRDFPQIIALHRNWIGRMDATDEISPWEEKRIRKKSRFCERKREREEKASVAQPTQFFSLILYFFLSLSRSLLLSLSLFLCTLACKFECSGNWSWCKNLFSRWKEFQRNKIGPFQLISYERASERLFNPSRLFIASVGFGVGWLVGLQPKKSFPFISCSILLVLLALLQLR